MELEQSEQTWYLERAKYWIILLAKQMEETNEKDFLDLGCGIGRHTILFAQNGFNTYAFDLSEEAVNATKSGQRN